MLDLRGISSFTDFFVICSGTSEPQLKAIANEIETSLREHYSLRPVAVDGFPASQWMVLDRSGKQPSHSYQLIHRRIDISATEIRRRVAQQESIRYLVPDSVDEIIQREKLYREQSQ